jgi:hypothetical protein
MVYQVDGFSKEPNAAPTISGWMKRCSGRERDYCAPWRMLPDLENPVTQALTSPGVVVFLQHKIGWRQIDAPPKPGRPIFSRWGASNETPQLS